MPNSIPRWALELATTGDRRRAEQARQQKRLQVTWPKKQEIRAWAKARGWPTPLIGFRNAFLKTMLDNNENFALALAESGVVLTLPAERYVISPEGLAEYDALYDERSESGRPTDWGPLVAGLREIRRAVEAGVVVEVEGQELKSWASFYNWAHGRYPLLEDGYDSWIGDDES